MLAEANEPPRAVRAPSSPTGVPARARRLVAGVSYPRAAVCSYSQQDGRAFAAVDFVLREHDPSTVPVNANGALLV
jgi:hypothetical protein